MFNIPDHKGNANQNDIEISSHPSQNDCHQEFKHQPMLVKIQKKRNTIHFWWECKLVEPLWKAVWKFSPKKPKNRIIIRAGDTTLGMEVRMK
jgi:hypothetical protein